MDKKQEILLAAEQAFLKYGIKKITLSDIAQACGMKKTALYYYFKNKESIIREMLELKFSKINQEVLSEVESVDSVQEKLRKFMHSKILLMRDHLRLMKLFDDESLSFRNKKFMDAQREQVMGQDFCLIRQILEKGIKNHKVSYEVNDSLVLMILGVTYGSFIGKFIEDANWNIDEMVATTIDVIFKGIE